MCELLSLFLIDVLSLDCVLVDIFILNVFEGFNLLGIYKNIEGESFIVWR